MGAGRRFLCHPPRVALLPDTVPAESIELPLYVPRGRGGEEHRSIELSFRYADDNAAVTPEVDDEERRIHHGLGVPLADSIGRLGFLTVYSCEEGSAPLV